MAHRTEQSLAFARRLRKLLSERGLNAISLEYLSGIHRQTTYHWLAGDQMPYMPMLYQLREVLGCTWADLFGEDGS